MIRSDRISKRIFALIVAGIIVGSFICMGIVYHTSTSDKSIDRNELPTYRFVLREYDTNVCCPYTILSQEIIDYRMINSTHADIYTNQTYIDWETYDIVTEEVCIAEGVSMVDLEFAHNQSNLYFVPNILSWVNLNWTELNETEMIMYWTDFSVTVNWTDFNVTMKEKLSEQGHTVSYAGWGGFTVCSGCDEYGENCEYCEHQGMTFYFGDTDNWEYLELRFQKSLWWNGHDIYIQITRCYNVELMLRNGTMYLLFPCSGLDDPSECESV